MKRLLVACHPGKYHSFQVIESCHRLITRNVGMPEGGEQGGVRNGEDKVEVEQLLLVYGTVDGKRKTKTTGVVGEEEI